MKSKIRESHTKDIDSGKIVYRLDTLYEKDGKKLQSTVDFMANEDSKEKDLIPALHMLLNDINHKGVDVSDLLDLPLDENQRYLPMDVIKDCILQSSTISYINVEL